MKRIVNRLLLLTFAATLCSLVVVSRADTTAAEPEKPAEASAEAPADETEASSEESAEEPAEATSEEAEGEGHDNDADHAEGGHAEGSDGDASEHGDSGAHSETAAHGGHGGHGGHQDLGHGDASPSIADPSALNRDLAVYTLVVFAGLFLLLLKFAWPTISEALEAREKRIEQNIADAESQLEKAKTIVAEHEATMANAADQVRELLEEARRDADATISTAKAEAKAEFEAERQRATRDIEQASDAAVRQLAEKTAGLAIDLAGRVVKQDISADRQSEIVREALGAFSNAGPSDN